MSHHGVGPIAPCDPGTLENPRRPTTRVMEGLDLRRNEPRWQELENLLRRIGHRGVARAHVTDVLDLAELHRQAAADLALAREIVLDRTLVTYLEALVGRAHLVLHASRRPRRGSAVIAWIRALPSALVGMRIELLLATMLLVLGTIVGWSLTQHDAAWFFALVDPSLATGHSPLQTTEQLEQGLRHTSDGWSPLLDFAGSLFVHNARVGLLAFTLGIVAGLPTAYLLFTNGLSLGAFGALYFGRGLGGAWLGWLLPHAIPELVAVIACGAAGLTLGRALLFPGNRLVGDALRQTGSRALVLVLLAAVLFALAGFIEGVLRQTVVDDAGRFMLALAHLSWILPLGVATLRSRGGRR